MSRDCSFRFVTPGLAVASQRDTRPGRGKRLAGVTLVELLVASTILVLILAAGTGLFAGSSRAYRVSEGMSERQQEIESAVKIMTYDLALAGYRGTTPEELADRSFAGPTLEVQKDYAEGSDRLVVRYYEDAGRFFGGDSTCDASTGLCEVTYTVQTDADAGGLVLVREANDGEIGIVQAVDHFLVLNYIQRDGTGYDEPVTATTPVPSDLAALNIEIAFDNGGTWRFPIGVNNPQNLP